VGNDDFEELMPLMNLLWYGWRLWRLDLPKDFEAPLWWDRRQGWIYRDGSFKAFLT
jgi:hypothetical protein